MRRAAAWLLASALVAGALIEFRVSLELSRELSVIRPLFYGAGLHLIAFAAYRLDMLLIPTDLLRDEQRRRISYLSLLHLLVALSFLPVVGVTLPPVVLGLGLLVIRCALFVGHEIERGLSSADRWYLAELAGTWVLWGAVATVYLFIGFEDGVSGLVWDTADARHYHWLSNELLTLDFEPAFFPLGLPLVLAPLNLVSGTFASTDLASLARLNGASLVILAFVVTPAGLFLTGTACREVFLDRERQRPVLAAVVFPVVIIGLLAYAVWFQPGFISPRDAKYHPIMMFGLTPSVEPLSFLFAAATLHFAKDIGRFSVVTVGVFVGVAALVKETNVLIGGVLAIVLWVGAEQLWRLVAVAAVSVAAYGVQLAHNVALHGTLWAANRTYQWDLMAHRWTDYVHAHYGLSFLGSDPPRLSPAYVTGNLERLVSSYWLPLVLVVAAWVFLSRSTVRVAYVSTFAFAVVVAFVLLHLGYMRSGAIFRYLHSVLPMAMFLLVGAVSTMWRYRSMRRSAPGRLLTP